MTTVINNPGDGANEGSGMGMIVGIILAVILIGLFLVYGLPRLRGNSSPAGVNVDVNLPSGNSGAAPAQ